LNAESSFVTLFNIVWCHSENNAPHHLNDVSFVTGVPEFEDPEDIPTLIVLDDIIDSAYSKKSQRIIYKRIASS
jgi:hypothetical protein